MMTSSTASRCTSPSSDESGPRTGMPRICLFHLLASSSRNATGCNPNCGFLCSSRTTRVPASPAPTIRTFLVLRGSDLWLASRASPMTRTDIAQAAGERQRQQPVDHQHGPRESPNVTRHHPDAHEDRHDDRRRRDGQRDRNQVLSRAVPPVARVHPEGEVDEGLQDQRRQQEDRELRMMPKEEPVQPEGECAEGCNRDQRKVGEEDIAVAYHDSESARESPRDRPGRPRLAIAGTHGAPRARRGKQTAATSGGHSFALSVTAGRSYTRLHGVRRPEAGRSPWLSYVGHREACQPSAVPKLAHRREGSKHPRSTMAGPTRPPTSWRSGTSTDSGDYILGDPPPVSKVAESRFMDG